MGEDFCPDQVFLYFFLGGVSLRIASEMKTFLTILLTALVKWFFTSLFHGARSGVERLWLISAIKAPGRMALGEIQEDMHAGRYNVAKEKIDVFVTTWQRFSSGPDSFRGEGIGDIMVAFSGIPSFTNGVPSGAELPVKGETKVHSVGSAPVGER